MQRVLARFALVLWAGGLVTGTHARLLDWRSDRALWSAAVQSDPALVRPHVNLAVTLESTAAALAQWDAAAVCVQRDHQLPLPPDTARLIAITRATLTAAIGQVDNARVIAREAGCSEIAPMRWSCPPP